jgi:GT2 family glycosyltransferase
MTTADRRREKVFMAYPSHGTIDAAFHDCVVRFLAHDSKGQRRVVDGAHQCFVSSMLPVARNKLVREFLDRPGLDWLWFVDTDQVFAPDTLERMLAAADPVERPILGALIFAYVPHEDSVWPTMWQWGADGLPRIVNNYRPGQVNKVGATGTGCVLIHRSVFEKIAATEKPGAGKVYGDTPWPWFQYGEWVNQDGKPDTFGEDLTFMLRANVGCDIPVHVDTGIQVGHVKDWVVTQSSFLERAKIEELAARTVVVIPVKDKPDLTKGIVRQLRAQGGYDELVLVDNGSQRPLLDWYKRQSDIVVLDGKGQGIHQMWNAGAAYALSSWPKANLIFLNNDLELGPEFCTRLSTALRSSPTIAACCPNYDGRLLGDGQTMRLKGICANRYDGTGGLCGFAFAVRSEVFMAGYRFPEDCMWWFGDNDLCMTIDESGHRYVMAGGCTVVHLDGGGQTGDWESPEIQPQLLADQAAFTRRWGAVLKPQPTPVTRPPLRMGAGRP